jgi:hypothetical protein
MATGSARTPQQRDAHELARIPQANPYRGAMLDPFATSPADPASPADSASPADPASPSDSASSPPSRSPAIPHNPHRPARTRRPARSPADRPPVAPWASTATPTAATVAGVLGLALSLAMALFGISLLALLTLQSDFGAPDRSFYRGADSGSVVLALIDFGLAGGCAVGGMLLMGGRVLGRIACTVAGWLILCLSAFWYLRGHASAAVPVTVALAAGAMLLLSYQASVTRWLGVLLPAQPD